MSYLRKIGKNYVIQFRWEGKTIQRSLGTSNRKDAMGIRAAIDSELWRNNFPTIFKTEEKNAYTIHDLRDKLYKYWKEREKLFSPGTIETYKYNYQVLQDMLGDMKLHRITDQYVDNQILPLLLSNHKKSMVRHHMVHFRAFFSKAVDWQMIEKNPFSRKVPKLEKKQPRYLKAEELALMSEYFSKDSLPRWQYEIVFLAVNTGLRKSEICRLNWRHVDLINEQLIFPGKGNKERLVPLNDTALSILQKRNQSKIKNINGRVFQEISSTSTLDSAWQRFQAWSGIKVRFHDLRSTFASYWVMNGGDLIALQKILGHEDIQMTMVYATVDRNALHRNKNVVGFV